eukprot:CAMPEP_0174369828 /NCGR_PEP_ID=MMETSP0811_2-20130205/93892_1 /TAXON_ID=73025 ORGANISM="Eutreptiella gymnastica-like, Strain CCMP1594" /NCGR_SAMPLE_ID=MMETSP0811_2 /ASSEMBLY_ACC=CAM_ASM_000667 /LENGTH=58 /DNA_ID=CAMNT_0015514665 /DNA_START=35 /DNA_END=212 /DNA_ORIENTATION=-
MISSEQGMGVKGKDQGPDDTKGQERKPGAPKGPGRMTPSGAPHVHTEAQDLDLQTDLV